jgi:hypothetical protein
MNIQKITLVIVFVLCSISSIFSAHPWKKLAYEQEGYMDNRSGFVDHALFAFADHTAESVREKIGNYAIRDLSRAWSSVAGDECFALCTLAQSGNFEKLESMMRHYLFKKEELQTALQFARKEKFFAFYESLSEIGLHDDCIALLSAKINQQANN